MALPTSTNNVTVRKLSSTIDSLWTKIKTLVSAKATKVTSATSGNFAGLDANGDLTDSGKKSSDFATSAQGSKADSAIQGIQGNGTTITPSAGNIVNITTSNIGLGNVTNDAQVKRSEMGVANGVATLDGDGKVPSSQLPSYVDDVVEGYYYNSKFYKESSHTTEITPHDGIIYVDVPNNKTYRWGGTQYVLIASDLALGETASTAYRGDHGKAAYDHSLVTSGNPHNVTKSDVGLGSVVNTGDSATPVSGGTTKFTTGGAYTELAKKLNTSAKVTAFQTTPDNDHIPSEKLVKDNLDLKANASEMSVVAGTGSDADKTTITLKSGTSATVLTAHQSLSGYKTTQTAVSDPSASGTTIEFIATISQNAQGVITPTKKSVREASVSGSTGVSGLMSGSDKVKLDGIATGATKVESSTTNGSIKINGTATTVYTHPTATATTAAAVKVGNDAAGHVVLGAALAKGDVGLGNVDNTSDATKKSNFTGAVEADNTGFPTGDAVYQAIQSSTSSVTNEKLGQGYSATSSLSSGTFSVTLANYDATKFGVVVVKFGNAVPASAKLNINSKGAKSIYWKGAAIGADVIQQGDTASFMYDGTYYHLLSIDRDLKEMTSQEVTDLLDALT